MPLRQLWRCDMSDLISRQALLNKFEPWLKVKDYSDGELNMLKAVLYEIRFMPYATDKNVGTKLSTNLAEVGTDCISRQQAIDALRKMQTYKLFSGDDMLLIDQAGAQTELMLLPSAQPEIVRCKDCKHWIPYDWMFSEVWQSKNIADYPEDEIGCDCCDMAMKANDFCSRAEKREVTE